MLINIHWTHENKIRNFHLVPLASKSTDITDTGVMKEWDKISYLWTFPDVTACEQQLDRGTSSQEQNENETNISWKGNPPKNKKTALFILVVTWNISYK